MTESSNEDYSFVSYEIDENKNLAILYLNECNYNDEYINCVNKMFTKVKELDIENVAVDLRGNGGGYSTVANEFIRYLNVDEYLEWGDEQRYGLFMYKKGTHNRSNYKYDDLVFDGNVYILTSVSTFSAAMDFAEYIKDNNLGTIIGEASGNNPSSYGDIVVFKLPNSGMQLSVSRKKWHRIDTTKEGELIEPDIPCNSSEVYEALYKAIGVN